MDKKRTNLGVDKFWTDYGQDIFSKLAIAHSICPGIVHHNVVLEWAESGPWVAVLGMRVCHGWAMGGPWVGHGWAMGKPWLGHGQWVMVNLKNILCP